MTDTIYAADAHLPLPSEAELPQRTDALVVGGGLTGLSAALHLTRHGYEVTLLEAGRIADGASGRNGGQLHPGQRRDQMFLEARFGDKMANALWRLGIEAIELVHSLRAELRADCDYRPGLIEAAHTQSAFDDLRRYADHLAARYGTTEEILERPALAEAIGTTRYVGGVRAPSGGHMNPLAFASAIAERAHVEGARLHAGVRVTHHRLTPQGFSVTAQSAAGRHQIRAGTVILAGNGYLRRVNPALDARVMPLVNYILATEPLPARRIPGGEAVADTRHVIRYWREDAMGRMIFGGGEGYGVSRDIARLVRPYLAELYPDLARVPVAAAWAGTLGITRLRIPIITRLEPGLYAGTGYSGQGLGIATFAGKVLADAIAGETSRLDVFARLPAPAFPGGPLFQTPLARLALLWFALRDRLGR